LVVASVAAVCFGGLLGVWAYTSVTTAQEVVAVRTTIQRGALISRDDLVAVRIGVDPALKPIPAVELDGVVGQRAAMDLPAGGLVTQGSITATVVPAQDMSVVGVAVPAVLLPGEPLRAGDQVRVVATPGQQGEVTDGSSDPSPPPLSGCIRMLTAARRGQRSGALRPGG
jgi:flagella basal body P-ring formation protein FlgA